MRVIAKSLKMMPLSIRWAFDTSRWNPTEREFLLASSCLQPEEKERIGRFVFKKDVKASLVGRLMIRKFVSQSTGIPYNEVKITRDENNKPSFQSADKSVQSLSFNVSHQGSFTVFVGETENIPMGVDVMKLEYTGGKNLSEFFRLMRKNFSDSEWDEILHFNNDGGKIAMFCRHWALKESYLKAVGIGITVSLKQIDFSTSSKLCENEITMDTILKIDGKQKNWIFEESLITADHCVSVAFPKDDTRVVERQVKNPIFEKLSVDSLLEGAIPQTPNDFEYCRQYFAKKERPNM